MKPFTSFQELDALGEGLSKDYIARTHRWNARCFDIEGFITDYLGLAIVYESSVLSSTPVVVSTPSFTAIKRMLCSGKYCSV